MAWDERRAKRSNLIWMGSTVALVLLPVMMFAGCAMTPSVWTRTAWQASLAGASDVRDYPRVAADSDYDAVVSAMGEPLYSGPGFERSGHVDAAVYYWRTDEGDVRGLVIDDRLVGSLKIGRW